MRNDIKVLGKFLDQPMLISKLNKQMPIILGGMGTACIAKTAYDTFKPSKHSTTEEKQQRKKTLINKSIVLSTAIASALLAPKLASKITKRVPFEDIKEIKKANNDLINKFLKNNDVGYTGKRILEKAKNKVLNLSEIKTLINSLKTPEQKEFFEKLIPNPKNINAKDIFQEIGYLSVYGAIPVLGGIAGGIAADKITDSKHSKEKIPDKISEGLYQYLANIFLCNIGAGAALGILEKANITSKSARAIGMTAGIILTGVVGGSKIANAITKNILSPVLNKHTTGTTVKERTPEALDIGLHSDDIATVSLLSGLKWIEPALPALYSISGYRAGIGYRN